MVQYAVRWRSAKRDGARLGSSRYVADSSLGAWADRHRAAIASI